MMNFRRCFLASITPIYAIEKSMEMFANVQVAPSGPPRTPNETRIQIHNECPQIGNGPNWVEVADELYAARALLYEEDGHRKALDAVMLLLRNVTKKFSEGFACTIGTASVFWTAAQMMAHAGFTRRATALIHMGFIFVRDRGFHECTPWPVQGWDMLLSGRELTQKTERELDKPLLAGNPFSDKSQRIPQSSMRPGDQFRVAIVSICSYAPDETVRVVSMENHRIYADLHGYDLYMFTDPSQIAPHLGAGMNVSDGVHKPFFWKVNAVMNVFDGETKYDWAMWIDCDALYMDPERTIDSVILTYAGHPGLLGPPAAMPPDWASDRIKKKFVDYANTEVEILLATDSTGINNGVWMLRNSDWGRDFLKRWWHSDILDGPGKNHNCSDQSTMQHQLLYEGSVEATDEEWDLAGGPVWPAEVPQEHMQSFHYATAQTVLSREWTDGDFVKHHPGCHYYKMPCQYLYMEAEGIFIEKYNQMVNKLNQQRTMMMSR